MPENLPIGSDSITLIDLLCNQGWVKSRGEARRLIAQGGVELDGEKITDSAMGIIVLPGQARDLKVGKKIRRVLKND